MESCRNCSTSRFIILIFSIGEGFGPNNLNLGWGLERPNPFQPPTVEHRYPPFYDFLFPRRTQSQPMCPAFQGLTRLGMTTQTQINGFMKDGRVNLFSAFAEVQRRVDSLGWSNHYTF